jgi:hypothetical protein
MFRERLRRIGIRPRGCVFGLPPSHAIAQISFSSANCLSLSEIACWRAARSETIYQKFAYFKQVLYVSTADIY